MSDQWHGHPAHVNERRPQLISQILNTSVLPGYDPDTGRVPVPLGMDEHANPTAETAPAGTSYDAVPYSVTAFPQTHPDRLAVIAMLFGMTPTPPTRCRVLELGCARGGNLLPMALGSPESEFVGIDLSAKQIADAQSTARELGLRNIRFEARSITEVDDGFRAFDYILAHGVYSWVPPEVQDRILRICRRNLSPSGVAYVSYNCLPGWHARGAIREMLWYHTRRFADPAERVRAARGLLAFLALSVPGGLGGYGALVRQELAVLQKVPDTYLLHEHLEEYNEPLYFHEFMERASAHDLQYLGEAQLGTMLASNFTKEAEKTLRQISPDLLHMEQYMDFLRNRMFRQTLLCHANVPLDRALRPEAVKQFYIASAAKPVPPAPEAGSTNPDPQQFKRGELTLSTQDPLMKSAMMCLAETWPLPIPFDDLLARARSRASPPATADAQPSQQSTELATRLLHCYSSTLAEFSLTPPRFTTDISARPLASPYARLRAVQGDAIVNMRLERVELGPPARKFLQWLDGRHDQAELAKLMSEWIHPIQPTLPEPELASQATAFVAHVLPMLARAALLVG